MKISVNWLSDYVDHGLSVDDLAERLTMCGLEVEDVEKIGSPLEGVVVGHVLETGAHPKADRLTVCRVDLGSGDPVSIVCGAPNVAPGQKVCVATVGSTISVPSRDNPSERVPVKIKKTKIRGEVSQGMICAEAEVGLSDENTGIMVLDENAAVGQAFAEYLSKKGAAMVDHAIDIAITPNRPDAACHLGVARDISALTGAPFSVPTVDVPEAGGEAADAFSVHVEAPDACHRYVGVLVKDVAIGESPSWLQQRLRAIGLRSRNNVVDITNYVMYEFGQPLHAFDFDLLAGPEITVRRTRGTTKFTTLDGLERDLPDGTLMIADGERDIAIAGVMGGENSEVTESTRNVLIESAYFEPSGIRRTAKALQLQTDASYRFERGVDPTGQARAAMRAAEMMEKLASGRIVDGLVDAHPIVHSPTVIRLRKSRVKAVLGVKISGDRITRLLSAIGFEVESEDGGNTFSCSVPPYRPDVEREIDVIEEIARLYGFDNIPEPVRSSVPNHPVQMTTDRKLREQTRDLLVGLGYRETCTNSMLKKETAQTFLDEALPGGRFGGEVIETLNPISQEMSTLRPSLLPGVLVVVSYNQNRGRNSIRFFEFGRVHVRVHTEHSIVANYTERECLIVVLSGDRSDSGWDTRARSTDIFDLKGVAENVLEAIRLPEVRFEPVKARSGLVDQQIAILSAGERVGVLGRLATAVAESGDLRAPLYFLELDWSTVCDLAAPHFFRTYEPFSRHPVVERDIAVLVDRSTPVGPMMDVIRSAGGLLLSSIKVFDLYEGERIDANSKSVAFALTFGADRTLRDAEVDKRVATIVEALEKEYDAQLRE